MSQLFTTTGGQGRPLIVLHGWGMNQQVWAPIRQSLEQLAQVTWIDLPGHGQSRSVPFESLDGVLEQLSAHLSNECIILGWSLGGLLAQALAQSRPEKISALILVATSPRFTVADDWLPALSEEVLQSFADNLKQDYQATVKRFFALQFMGVRHDPLELTNFRESILHYPASQAALANALTVLRTADYRQPLLKQSALWVLGRLDKLIPSSLAESLQGLGYAQVELMPKAAHLPFVTHPHEFMQLVQGFLHAH